MKNKGWQEITDKQFSALKSNALKWIGGPRYGESSTGTGAAPQSFDYGLFWNGIELFDCTTNLNGKIRVLSRSLDDAGQAKDACGDWHPMEWFFKLDFPVLVTKIL